MAIDTKVQETLKNHTRIKNMRRGGSPEPSCQLPTAPAHTSLIPLTQGKFVIVDAKNYEWLNQWKWCVSKSKGGYFYAVRGENQNGKWRRVSMHRLILKCQRCEQADHKNHNTLDNREENLRKCTHAQNQYNRIPNIGTSKYKGVHLYRDRNKWHAQIQCKYKRHHLGWYKSDIEAAKAYDAKAVELFGEFAYTNF